MARPVSRSQLQSQLRQAQSRQRQAISNYNTKVRKVNRAIDDYNRKARAHNTAVRANSDRLRRELQRLSRTTSTTVRYTVYHRSVVTLQQSFARLERATEAPAWLGDDELLELSEGETANSVAVLNALLADTPSDFPNADQIAALQATTITGELANLDADLDSRWRGALFALHPLNPDATRHFCTSARELLDRMLDRAASDMEVLSADPSAARTARGSVTRRARIVYCLQHRGSFDESLAAFIEDDLDNVVALFRDFNDGTHGHAGRFDLAQLQVIKHRVEDAIRFVARIAP